MVFLQRLGLKSSPSLARLSKQANTLWGLVWD
jgi:hypothetical protein